MKRKALMYSTGFCCSSKPYLPVLILVLGLFAGLQGRAVAGEAPGWLGVEVQAMTEELARAFGLRHTEGVVVTEVVPGSPAERAALHVGDVIIKYADESITSPELLKKKIQTTAPGKHVRIEVVRFWGKVRLLRALIEAHASTRPVTHIRTNPRFDQLGLQLAELTLAQRVRFGTGMQGVLVREAGAGTPGLESGDVILMFADKPVSSVQALIDQIGAAKPGRTLPILIQREHKRFYMPLTIPVG
jgi:serine protease Do